ncbi:MAG: hypothetical protein HOP11_10405 [Saprospiraceae bacterium]|nr:hypothetical protein [Saprospiraceae bacterium]
MLKGLSIRVSKELIGKIIRESRSFIAEQFMSNLENLNLICDGRKIATINIYQCDE